MSRGVPVEDCSPNSPVPEIPPTGLCSGSSVGLSPQGQRRWLTHTCICAPGPGAGAGLSVPVHV